VFEKGKHKRNAPKRMTEAKPKRMNFAGVILNKFFNFELVFIRLIISQKTRISKYIGL